MAFWDNFSQKASETTAKAVQRAKEMSDIARINSMISEEETKINNIYYQIGKLYVTIHPHDHEEEFTGMIVSLAEAEEKIKNYRQQIQDIKGVVRCSQCGAEVPSSVAFCSSCGVPMPKIQPVNTEDVVRCEGCGAMIQVTKPEISDELKKENKTSNKICPKCGAKIETDVAFCTECGTKL